MKATLCWFLLTGSALCQTLTLKEALHRMAAANPTLIRQQHERLASQAVGDRTESDLYPHATLEAAVKDGPPGTPNFRLLGLPNAGFPQSAGGSLILTQVFDFGRTSQRLHSQRQEWEALGQDLTVERRRQALHLMRFYGQVVLSRQLKELARTTIQSRQQLEKQADARFRGGLASRVDLRLVEAETARARADEAELRAQEQQSQAALYAAMGDKAGPDLGLESWPQNPENWVTDEMTDLQAALLRPEALAARSRVAAAESTLQAAQAGYNPYLSLYAAGGYIGNLNGAPSSPNTFAVGMAFSLPIYTAGGVQAEVRQAEEQIQAALAREQEVSLSLTLQVQQARTRFFALCERRLALQAQQSAALEASRLARTRYRLGLNDVLELQQSELTRLRSETEFLRNRGEIWLAWGELLYATGRLNQLGVEEKS